MKKHNEYFLSLEPTPVERIQKIRRSIEAFRHFVKTNFKERHDTLNNDGEIILMPAYYFRAMLELNILEDQLSLNK